MTKAIRVENLSKLYHIGQGKTARYETLGERITDMLTGPLRSMRSVLQGQSSAVASDSIWALKDVSFEVNHGEVVGIIGRNGAGKSTLLKILSQITEPTAGHIDLYGRVGALLEVGTGFHQELTGRENVFLNGAILGMTRNDIQRKFDEIVDFSGVEKFIDTPVKHYSSGMQVRLAFAVAAHLEPEILVVDEVLAVGDAEFQKKCLGKMGDVTNEGRTVLFVSHNMAAVQSLCKRCILLQDGCIEKAGSTRDVVDAYLNSTRREFYSDIPGDVDLTIRGNRDYKGSQIIQRIRLINSTGVLQNTFLMGQAMHIVVDVQGLSQVPGAHLGIQFYSESGQRITAINTLMTGSQIEQPRQDCEQFTLHIPRLPFTSGKYYINVVVRANRTERIDFVEDAIFFFVTEADIYGTGYQITSNVGLVYLDANWLTDKSKDLSPQTRINIIHR